MKTIKQVADELQISKQRVYRFVKSNCITDVHQKDGVMYISDAVNNTIKEHFFSKIDAGDAHHNTVNDAGDAHCDVVSDAVSANQFAAVSSEVSTLVSALQQQLEVKDQQIAALQQSLNDTTQALLEAQKTAQTAQALHAGTIQNQLLLEGEPQSLDNEKEASHKGWFGWLRRK